eukprot:6201712-Pleurochrysis_carterae.AAC.8
MCHASAQNVCLKRDENRRMVAADGATVLSAPHTSVEPIGAINKGFCTKCRPLGRPPRIRQRSAHIKQVIIANGNADYVANPMCLLGGYAIYFCSYAVPVAPFHKYIHVLRRRASALT